MQGETGGKSSSPRSVLWLALPWERGECGHLVLAPVGLTQGLAGFGMPSPALSKLGYFVPSASPLSQRDVPGVWDMAVVILAWARAAKCGRVPGFLFPFISFYFLLFLCFFY